MLQNGNHGQENTAQIHPKTLMLHIVAVQLCLLGNGQRIPPVNLCPARQPGKHIVGAVPIPLPQKIILIPQRRPGPHNTHLSPDNVQKLRKLIQAGLPQKFSCPGNILIRILQKMCRHILRSIRPHGAELENLKIRFVDPHPLLPEKNRSRRIQLHPEAKPRKQRAQNNQRRNRQQQIHGPLSLSHDLLLFRLSS